MEKQLGTPQAAKEINGGDGVGGIGDRSNDASALLTSRTALAVILVLAYWATVFVLPAPDRVGSRAILHEGVLVSATIVVGVLLVLLFVGAWKEKLDKVATLCVATFVIMIGVLLLSAFGEWISYTNQIKFAIAVGGTAIASFVFGIVVYDTLRVAASLPIVILLIGLATFPAGFTAGEDLRGQIILWMGGILGVATLAEGITQAVRIRGSADVRSEVVKAMPTDGDAIARVSQSLTSDIQKIGGDLSAPVGVQAGQSGLAGR
jgi:hypothetical protein